MGLNFPNYPGDVQGGDEPTFAPTKNDRGLLGAERGTDQTRRLELDSSRNLYVRVAADDTAAPASVTALAGSSVTGVTDNTLTTILTYTAPAAVKLTRIGVSGTDYAKFQLFLNTVLVETKRSGPDRSLDFMFTRPLALASSDVLDVKVTHYNTGLTSNFESTVYGA